MTATRGIRSVVVMGVSGSGKSTIGTALAKRLDFEFFDADWFHPQSNVERMASGHALTDHERMPWLRAVGQRLREGSSEHLGSVVACSALKRAYRDVLRSYVPDAFFVLLDGSEAVIRARMLGRPHDFMPVSLLASQFASLEALGDDERGTSIDAVLAPGEIIDLIEVELRV